MSEYAGKQFVGIDLHRRRSVIVRTTESGEVLESVRILNDVESLDRGDRAWRGGSGGGPRGDLRLDWAVDALQAAGANVHLAHPLGVKAFEYRRVKNDFRDAADLADLLRMGRLPEAWIAPPATRELRELVRHRAKLVALRSHCKAEVHAVLAKCGIQVLMTDLFGVDGTALLDRWKLPAPYAARITSLRRLLEDLGVRDRPVHQPGPGPSPHRPRLRGVAADPRDRPGPRGSVPRRGRRCVSVRHRAAAGLLGRADPQAPRVRHPRTAAGSPSRAPGWSAGPRWNRSNWSAHALGSAPYETGSQTAAAPTSARSPPPGCRWSTSTTGCLTVTSAHCSTPPRSRHEPPPHSFWSVARSCRS